MGVVLVIRVLPRSSPAAHHGLPVRDHGRRPGKPDDHRSERVRAFDGVDLGTNRPEIRLVTVERLPRSEAEVREEATMED
jgi:hypothetical protein